MRKMLPRSRYLAYPPASRAAFAQAIFRLALIFFQRLGINLCDFAKAIGFGSMRP
jgi:hypothetical protein